MAGLRHGGHKVYIYFVTWKILTPEHISAISIRFTSIRIEKCIFIFVFLY